MGLVDHPSGLPKQTTLPKSPNTRLQPDHCWTTSNLRDYRNLGGMQWFLFILRWKISPLSKMCAWYVVYLLVTEAVLEDRKASFFHFRVLQIFKIPKFHQKNSFFIFHFFKKSETLRIENWTFISMNPVRFRCTRNSSSTTNFWLNGVFLPWKMPNF